MSSGRQKLGSNIHIWGTKSDRNVASPLSTKQPRAFPLGHSRSKNKKTSASGWHHQAMKRAHTTHDNIDTTEVDGLTGPSDANSSRGTIRGSNNKPTRVLSPPSSSLHQTKHSSTSTNSTQLNQHFTDTAPFPTVNGAARSTSSTSASPSSATELAETPVPPVSLPLLVPFVTSETSPSAGSPVAAAAGLRKILKRSNEHHSSSGDEKSRRRSDKKKKKSKRKKQSPPAVWERVLWKRQTSKDNYVPDTWLHSVNRQSPDTYERGYWTMVKHTAVLMQQLSIVVLFSTVFRLALTEDTEIIKGAAPSVSLSHLLLIDFVLVGTFYGMHTMLAKQMDVPHTAAHVLFLQPHRIILFLVILMAVSPVLHTLTKAYASDTIYMLALLLGGVHILFYDFTYVLTLRRDFQCTVSMNAALLTAVLLASRLSSNLHCFALICFALELFTLSPILRHMFREYTERGHLLFTTLLVLAVGVLLSLTHELFYTVLWLTASTVLPFLTPYLFIKAQVYKSVLWGPWDLGAGPNFNPNEPS